MTWPFLPNILSNFGGSTYQSLSQTRMFVGAFSTNHLLYHRDIEWRSTSALHVPAPRPVQGTWKETSRAGCAFLGPVAMEWCWRGRRLQFCSCFSASLIMWLCPQLPTYNSEAGRLSIVFIIFIAALNMDMDQACRQAPPIADGGFDCCRTANKAVWWMQNHQDWTMMRQCRFPSSTYIKITFSRRTSPPVIPFPVAQKTTIPVSYGHHMSPLTSSPSPSHRLAPQIARLQKVLQPSGLSTSLQQESDGLRGSVAGPRPNGQRTHVGTDSQLWKI